MDKAAIAQRLAEIHAQKAREAQRRAVQKQLQKQRARAAQKALQARTGGEAGASAPGTAGRQAANDDDADQVVLPSKKGSTFVSVPKMSVLAPT